MSTNLPSECTLDRQQSLAHGGQVLVVHQTELTKSGFDAYSLIVEVSGKNDLINNLFKDPGLLRGKQLECLFEGTLAIATLEIWTQHEFVFPSIHSVLHFTCATIEAPKASAEIYEFLLPHVHFGEGDNATLKKYGNGGFSQRFDSISFKIESIGWTLRHLYDINGFYQTAEYAFQALEKAGDENYNLMESGHAVLQVRASDVSRTDAEKMATDICWLLQLAFAQRVAWAELRARTGSDSKFQCRRAFTLPDKPSVIKALRNWCDHVIADYIERSYTVYQNDPKWWAETINWYSLAVENIAVESSSMIYCMLFDRVSTYILGDGIVPKQIGEDLAEGLADEGKRNQLIKQIDSLLKCFASSWSEERSINLVNQIRVWNDEFSYPTKARTAFEKLCLEAPSKKFLQRRHRLMHDGNLKLSKEKAISFFFDCHRHVLVLMLACLGYDGKLFCFGRGDCLMSDFRIVADNSQTIDPTIG